MSIEKAVEHLESAETTILSHLNAISNLPIDTEIDPEDYPDALPVLTAVLRSVARATGNLENELQRREIQEAIDRDLAERSL